ncbi:MAG: N(G),N(G)-dimethylarginine dimethylaminohydrolase [Desulfamplus sp.]|nr:N(G),N(G)-dimethylarginine dimethylaminohydrolase [Desulfamplus sp.]
MFTKAIARKPGKSLINGITSANLGKPEYEKALYQHEQYIQALVKCGLEVAVLEPDEAYPDSTFIEDVALLTKSCAIITNPGALSRQGETESIKPVLKDYFKNMEEITAPGTVEAGDIMMVGDHFYIGISDRTNENGARLMIAYLEKYGMTGSMVNLETVLHLKTGVSYLENNNLVATGEFLEKEEFQSFNLIEIEEDETYAANCIWVNGTVIVPAGYPKAQRSISEKGYPVIEVDVSEFRKLDGGLSCLSLRF